VTQGVGVVGAGLMGAGIAQVAAAAGHPVVLRDVTQPALDRAVDSIRDSYARIVRKERMTADEADAALARITTTTSLEEATAAADLVVEAVYERLDVKQEVFRQLDAVCPAGTVLATNTSAIPITSIAAVTQRPEDVVGTHFFSPVPVMQLCELVRGRHTSDRDIGGFVTTRLLVVLLAEAMRLVESGVATAEDIDTACRLGFGHTMGPLATADLTGTDIIRNAALNIHAETGEQRFFPPELLSRMVQAGDLGRKTGRGFYEYGS
jgi:3-hydroxybutyryl-CoA dehydrogenase